jgi:S1-C subfamily serine protease
MNNAVIEHVDALSYRLATQTIGAAAELKVLSQGDEKTVSVELVRAPEGTATELTIRGRSPFAGVKIAELSPRLAQKLGLDADVKGVTVVDIDRNSPAAGLGLQPRDIVREVNGEEITTAEKLKQVAETPSRWWRFTVERDGRLMRQTLRY